MSSLQRNKVCDGMMIMSYFFSIVIVTVKTNLNYIEQKLLVPIRVSLICFFNKFIASLLAFSILCDIGISHRFIHRNQIVSHFMLCLKFCMTS